MTKQVECTGCGRLFTPKRRRPDGENNFHDETCRLDYYKRKVRTERRVFKSLNDYPEDPKEENYE